MVKVSLSSVDGKIITELGQAETQEQAWTDIIEHNTIYKTYKQPYLRYWFVNGKQYCDFGSWSWYIVLEEI